MCNDLRELDAKRNGTLEARLRTLNLSSKHTAKRKGILHTITKTDIYNLWHQQDGRCAITRLPMEITTDKTRAGNPFIASIDRIDSNIGYVLGNIQLVLWQVNRAKSDGTLEELITMCKAIINGQSSLILPPIVNDSVAK